MRESSVNPGALAARLAALSLTLSAAGCAAHMRFVCPAQGGPEWREVTSDHFVLRTDLDARDAEGMTRELEQVRALLVQALDLTDSRVPTRTEVVAMATEEEFADFTGSRKYTGRAIHDEQGRQVLLVAGLLSRSDQSVLIAHEMAHSLSLYAVPQQPRWFAEGLATYLSSIAQVSKDGTRTVGSLPESWIADQLRFARVPTAREILAWSHSNESSLYAGSWLLVRFLATERPQGLKTFEERLARSEPATKAWNGSFPDWSLDRPGGAEALDALLAARAHDISGFARKVTAEVDPRIQVRGLAPAEVHTARLYLARMRKPDGLRAEVEEALQEDPGHVMALSIRAEEEPDLGLELARLAVRSHPEDAIAWRLLGYWLPRSAPREREAALRRAVDLAPDRADHLLALADEIESRDAAGGEVVSRRAVELAPWSADALLHHAESLAWLGRCEESASEMQRAQEILSSRRDYDPNGWVPSRRKRLERRCSVPAAARADHLTDDGYLELGDHPQRALALAEEAVRLDPDHTEAWLLRARALGWMGRREEAVAAHRKDLAVDPSSRVGWNELGWALLRLGRLAEAEVAFRKQVETDPDALPMLRDLARFLERAGKPREALAVLQPALARRPRNPDLLRDLGRTHLALGERGPGLAALEQAVSISKDPNTLNDAAYTLAVRDVEIARASAWAESSVGGHVAAIGKLSSHAARTSEPDRTAELLNAWDTLGWVRFRQGRIEDAERYVGAALRVQLSGGGFEHAGEISERKGFRDEAVVAYARAIATDGNLDARRRLEVLAPGQVDSLVVRARVDLPRLRILRREPGPPDVACDARVLLVLGLDGAVADVLPVHGGESLPGGAIALRGAPHGLRFPEPRPGRIVVRGRYRCADGVCAWFLGTAPVPEGPLPE